MADLILWLALAAVALALCCYLVAALIHPEKW
ncbi:K(+)-transporting ATPase subunit F [Psychromicrobium xiongbiense]|nr:K(+)-transporting ATPase subunit F [Psychromicrobium sp. YIM S02556]